MAAPELGVASCIMWWMFPEVLLMLPLLLETDSGAGYSHLVEGPEAFILSLATV